jgi:3'(2'), 5'-bisphosphate nucleotidase
MMTENKQLINLMILASLEAGEKILEIYNQKFEVEYKSDMSPLTIADQEANKVILKYLNQTQWPILSEESKLVPYDERRNWEYFWMVDPLDGTKEFIKHNGEFTVNIALIKNGQPILGVVFAPAMNKIFWGIVEENIAYEVNNVEVGTNIQFLHDNKQTIHSKSEDIPYKIVGSRSHSSPETEELVNNLIEKHSKVEFVSMGSSLKICLIANGSAQIYPRLAPTMEWDTAAGHAVALASGCEFFDAKTNLPIVYNKESLLNPWFIVEAINR